MSLKKDLRVKPRMQWLLAVVLPIVVVDVGKFEDGNGAWKKAAV